MIIKMNKGGDKIMNLRCSICQLLFEQSKMKKVPIKGDHGITGYKYFCISCYNMHFISEDK